MSANRDRLHRFSTALRAEQHVLAARPDCAFQQLHRHLQWEAADDPVLLAALRSGEQRQTACGRMWVRSETPPASAELEFMGHRRAVNSCETLPEEGVLVTGSADGTIRIWDVGTGRCHVTIRRETPWSKVRAHSLALIVGRSESGRIEGFEGFSGGSLFTLEGPASGIVDFDLTQDAEVVVVAKDGSVETWAGHPWRRVAAFQSDLENPHAVAAGSGDAILVAAARSLRLFERRVSRHRRCGQGCARVGRLSRIPVRS